jgi:site-specific DNA recombinase
MQAKEKNKEKAKVAFYTRISTDEDHQKYSLGAQKDRLEAFCKSQYGEEWELAKIYRDTDSGTHMNRPGLEEMLYDAECQAFNTLLVFRVDRLSRKVRELAQMVEELDKYGVALRSITEPFDTANAAGKMMLQMLGVFAEFEHATIVERTKAGLQRKAKSGRFVGGNVPYGYTLDPEKGLVINEEEALIVKKMFKMYVFGREGAFTISNKLNEAGHRKRSGKKWDKRIVLHMLKSPVYVGKIKWNEVVYEGTHDPIISDILYEKVQEVLRERSEEVKGRQFHNGDERLLSGIMRCGRCNSHMFGGGCNRNGVPVPYYVCSKRFTQHDCDQDYVRAELLETAIIQDLKNIFQDKQFMARIWKEANKRLSAEKPDIDKEIRKVEAQVLKTQTSIDRYFEAFEAGELKPALCNQKVQDLNARLEELEAEKQSLEARRVRLELPAIDKDMLKSLLENFDRVMSEGTNPQKKHFIKRLVKKIVIHDRRTIEIWYSLPNGIRVEDWHSWLPGPDSNQRPSG